MRKLGRVGSRGRRRSVDRQRGDASGADAPSGVDGVLKRLWPPRRSIASDIGATVRHQNEKRCLALVLNLIRQRQGHIKTVRDGRAPARRQPCQGAAGPRRRAGRRQHDFGAATAESDQRDAVAPDIAVGEQQFDRALHLRQPLHRRRTRSVEHEDRRRSTPLTVAHDAEIFRLRNGFRRRPGCASSRRKRCHGAAARNVATETQSAFPQRARARLGRTRALKIGSAPDFPSLDDFRRLERGDLRSEHIGDGGLHGRQHEVIEIGHLVVFGSGSRSCSSSGSAGGSSSAPARLRQPAIGSLAAQAPDSPPTRRRHPRPARREGGERPGGPQREEGRAQRGDPEPAATTTSASITDASTSTSPSFARRPRYPWRNTLGSISRHPIDVRSTK